MGEGVWTFSIVAHQRGLAKAQWSVVDTAAWLVKMIKIHSYTRQTSCVSIGMVFFGTPLDFGTQLISTLLQSSGENDY